MAEQHVTLTSEPSSDTLKVASETPLPTETDADLSLPVPRPPFMGTESPALGSPRDSYRDSYADSKQQMLDSKSEKGFDDEAGVPESAPPSKAKRRSLILALAALAVLAILIIVIVVPVYFTVVKPKNRNSPASSHHGGDATTSASPTATSTPGTTNAVSGGDGSEVTATNGTTFTYNNKFGGIWYADPNDPYSNNAYPNSWTPPLNTSWDFGANRIFGVNLGGWFVLEPFISPALFQKYPGSVDEWTLSQLMAADTANGGLDQLEEHYKTFITEDDIAAIAAAGLNWIRLPIPYWAIDVWDDEPFLARTSWKYILQALQWCRKYGLRVKLDLHTIPGSQNAYNHSGKQGQVNFLAGTMGLANAQRALNYIRIFAEFISQAEWKDVVPVFGIMNEPRMSDMGEDNLQSFYYEAYTMIREITGVGEGNGPYVSLHDGFASASHWGGFMHGADRIAIDWHPYFAFAGARSDPVDTGVGPDAGGTWPGSACTWGTEYNNSRVNFGVTLGGEWSTAINDCGLFVTGTTGSPTTGDCTAWNDWQSWTDGTKAGLMELAKATMDGLGDYFFWTWKIGPSATSGVVEAPFWSYKLGMEHGWIPTDPRTAVGKCGGAGPAFTGYAPWQTGGAGAGQMETTYAWPPASLAQLPTYVPSGVISTLPVPTYTDAAQKPIVKGNGWFNAADNEPAPTKMAGCTYPNAWDAQAAAVPAGCGAGVGAGAGAATGAALPTATDPVAQR